MTQSRRDALTTIATYVAGTALIHGLPIFGPRSVTAAPLPPDAEWLRLLATGSREERDASLRIEGRLPAGLRGKLYRNGPGLFERNGYRKGHLLDGDGMIRATTFEGGAAHFRNRFVRTPKFVEEDTAGRFRHATWGTRAPGGMLANLGRVRISQAGVTVYEVNGRLLAFDEGGQPFEIDPVDLATRGPVDLGETEDRPMYKAHTKVDGRNGDVVLFGYTFGASMTLAIAVVGRDGRLKSHRRVRSPRYTYVHDYFITERFVVVGLHALAFSPAAYLTGMKTFIESLSWRPDLGNLVAVIDREGEAEPRFFEAPASFMWHALNAYERGSEIVADFVAYDTPDHFVGEQAAMRTLMSGETGLGQAPGTVRRWTIDLERNRLAEAILDQGNHEFPTVDPHLSGHRHRIGYFAAGKKRGVWWHDGVARIDMEGGRKTVFHFGDAHYVGEPVFAPKPDGGPDDGWLLAEVLDGRSATTSIAVFDAAAVEDGPLARAHLPFHLPISFHGCWLANGA
jgi:all-trans-8'-apo-beta-carotenal 15,15'-oxygenase